MKLRLDSFAVEVPDSLPIAKWEYELYALKQTFFSYEVSQQSDPPSFQFSFRRWRGSSALIFPV